MVCVGLYTDEYTDIFTCVLLLANLEISIIPFQSAVCFLPQISNLFMWYMQGFAYKWWPSSFQARFSALLRFVSFSFLLPFLYQADFATEIQVVSTLGTTSFLTTRGRGHVIAALTLVGHVCSRARVHRLHTHSPTLCTARWDLLHLPARITFGTRASVWSSFTLWKEERQGKVNAALEKLFQLLWEGVEWINFMQIYKEENIKSGQQNKLMRGKKQAEALSVGSMH